MYELSAIHNSSKEDAVSQTNQLASYRLKAHTNTISLPSASMVCEVQMIQVFIIEKAPCELWES